MEFVYGGKKYKFSGVYREPKAGDMFLSNNGHVLLCDYGSDYASVRAIVTPVLDKVTVGGIEWEVIGEGVPTDGVWVYDADAYPWFSTGHGIVSHRIVRPIRVV